MSNDENISSESEDIVTPDAIVRDLRSRDVTTQLKAIQVLRSLLYEEDINMAAVVDAGVIPALVTAIDNDDCPNLQYQALGILTSIALASEDNTIAVANSGVIPKLISFLSLEDELSERSLLALESFALYSGAARTTILTAGVVEALLPYLTLETSPRTCLSHLSAFNKFCSQNEEDTLLNFELVSPALPSMTELLLSKELEILVEVCTALMNMMYDLGSIEAVQAVPSLTERLVPLLGHRDVDVREAAVGAVGNMLSGTEAQVDRCLAAGCLRPLIDLLQTSDHAVVGEAARAVGNILSGNHGQIQLALDSGVLTSLIEIVAHGYLQCQIEALRAVTQLCTRGSDEQRHYITTAGLLELLCVSLTHHDTNLAVQALNALLMLLKAASISNDRELESLCCALYYFDVIRQLEMFITNQGNGADDLENLISSLDSLKFEGGLEIEDLASVEFHQMFRVATMVLTAVRHHTQEFQCSSQDGKSIIVKEVVRDLWSQDTETKTLACRAVGFFATGNHGHPPLNALLDSGILPWAMETIDNGDMEYVTYAADVLLKITGGTQQHKMAVIISGALPRLVRLLRNCDDKLREIAASSLGNILRDNLKKERSEIITSFRTGTALDELKMFIGSYRNLSSKVVGSTLGEHEVHLLVMLPLVSQLINMEDIKILEDACWALANLMAIEQATGIVESVQTESKVTQRLVELLAHEDMRVREPALVAACSMLHGTSNQTNRLFECGFLDHLPSLLRSGSSTLMTHAAEAIACIFRKTEIHIELALEKNVLIPLTELLAGEDEGCMLKAAFAINCLCVNGSATQRARVASRSVLEPFCATLKRPGCATAMDVLNALMTILLNDASEGDKIKEFCLALEELSVLDNIRLQEQDGISEGVRHKANELDVILRKIEKGVHLGVVDGKIVTLAEIIQDLSSSNEDEKTRGSRTTCTLLFNNSRPIAELVDAGGIEYLVKALDSDNAFFHAVMSLLVIVDKGKMKHLKAVSKSGAIPKLIAMLSRGTSVPEKDCITRVLGTIVERDIEAGDAVISWGALQALVPYLRPDIPLEHLENLLDSCQEICGVQSDFSRISILLSCIPDLLQVEDEKILENTCRLLVTMIDGPDERYGHVLALPGVSARLVELLSHEADNVKSAALSVIGNMFHGTDEQKQHLLELDVLTPILKILDNPYDYNTKYNATCTLGNICTSKKREHIQALVDNRVIPRLMSLLTHEDLVVIKALQILAGISLHGPVMRDLVLSQGAVTSMRPHMRLGKPIELLRTCTLVFSSFCRPYPTAAVNFKVITPGIPYLFRLLEMDDIKVLENACDALANLLKSNHIEALQEVPELTERVVRLLSHKAVPVKLAALEVVWEFTLGNAKQVTRCLKANCLQHLRRLLQCKEPKLLENTVRIIGQIFIKIRGTVEMDWFKPLVGIIKREKCNSELHVLALSAIVNFSIGPKKRSIAIIDSGMIPLLVEILAYPGESLVLAAQILGNISKFVRDARESIEKQGLVPALVPYLKADKPVEILRLYAECLQVMIRYRMVTLEVIDPVLPYLPELLQVSDSVILTNTCKLILNLVSSPDDDIREAVLSAPGVTSRLLSLLGYDDIEVKTLAISIYVNILSKNDAQTELIFNESLDEIMDHFVGFLKCSDEYLVTIAARATANFFNLSSEDRIDQALDKGILEALQYVMEHGDIESREIAITAYLFFCERSTAQQRARAIEGGIVLLISSFLPRRDEAFKSELVKILEYLCEDDSDDDSDASDDDSDASDDDSDASDDDSDASDDDSDASDDDSDASEVADDIEEDGKVFQSTLSVSLRSQASKRKLNDSYAHTSQKNLKR